MPEPPKIKTSTVDPKRVPASTPQRRNSEPYEAPNTTVRTDRSYLRNTEAGQSKAQTAAVRAWEEQERNRKTENLAVVDENGVLNPLGSPVLRRTRSSVYSDWRKIPENAIVTHNHPYSGGKGLGAEIGISLSSNDIVNAIAQNNKEKRAVTGNYIFSIKRPAAGWGSLRDPSLTREENAHRLMRTIGREWAAIYNREALKHGIYGKTLLLKAGETREEYLERFGRIGAILSHRATTEIAKKYGFTYTRRRR